MPLQNGVKIRGSENELIELQGITNLRTVILGQELSKSGNIFKEIKEWLREIIIALLAGGAFLKFGPFEKLSPTERGILFVSLITFFMLLINLIEFTVCYIREKEQKG